MELSQSLEDCLEAIYLEIEEDGARVMEVAKKLEIRPPSVNQSIKRLEGGGYVYHENYGKIELTKKGEKHAKNVYERHRTLEKFLSDILDVGSERASREACVMEHGLSSETQKKLVKFVENYRGDV